MGEICNAIGWGIRFSFSVVTTQAELLAELTPPATGDSSAKADNSSADADRQNEHVNEDSERARAVDIVLLDTSIGDPLMQLVLEDCTECRVPVVCEWRDQSTMRVATHLILLFALANLTRCIYSTARERPFTRRAPVRRPLHRHKDLCARVHQARHDG